MDLPVMPPLKPMLAKLVPAIPDDMLYEPKFDGFRCIVFRDATQVELASRNERPLNRYFPELISAVREQLPPRCVVDGEIVLIREGALDFEALQQRIHPASSRVELLARATPASFVAFDLLALGGDSYLDRPFTERRAALERALADARPPIFTAPLTSSLELAREWFRLFEGAGMDGIIAKPPDVKYVPDRRAMYKVKHERTADCVVGGFRWHKSGDGIGSLLLGLYDDAGTLQHVGVAASFGESRRRQLVGELTPYRMQAGEPHPWASEGEFEHLPGEPSRWNRGKDQSWEPLRPVLVAEVGYDYMEGMRFRHVTQFKRWRPDREPESCTFEQLERPVRFDLADVLAGASAS